MPRPFLNPDKPFIREEKGKRFVLNGWRYRMAIRISSSRKSYFGPQIGKTAFKMLNVTADDATINFDAVIIRACELRQAFAYHNELTAYEKALEFAEMRLALLRVELNRVIKECIVNRRVSENIPQWNEELRAQGLNVIEFPLSRTLNEQIAAE